MNSFYLATKPTVNALQHHPPHPPRKKTYKKINKNYMVFQVQKCLNIFEFKMYITVFNSIVQFSSDFGS